jgi:hypothetical protein
MEWDLSRQDFGKIVDPATHAKLTHSSAESPLKLDNSLIECQFLRPSDR